MTCPLYRSPKVSNDLGYLSLWMKAEFLVPLVKRIIHTQLELRVVVENHNPTLELTLGHRENLPLSLVSHRVKSLSIDHMKLFLENMFEIFLDLLLTRESLYGRMV